MSLTVSVELAAETLGSLVDALGPGDEIVLTRDGRTVAKVIHSRPARSRRAGSCRGMLIVHEEDDAHLAAFKEYMP